MFLHIICMQVIELTEELLSTAQQNDHAGPGAGTSAAASQGFQHSEVSSNMVIFQLILED